MNLHFMVDEKVVTRAIKNFDKVLPEQNKYIIVIPEKDYVPQHVKIKAENIFFVTYGSKDFREAVGDIHQYKNVLIHLLTWDMVDFVNHHNHPAYTWMIWGGDLYNEFLEYMGYDMYYDVKAVRKAQGRETLLRKIAMPLEKIYHRYRVKIKAKAISRISYVCANETDLQLLVNCCPQFSHLRLKRASAYYPLDEIMNQSSCTGNNIIVGNSAYAAGNHVEVFLQLSKLNLGNRKVIVPLSYGDIADYILSEGHRILGEAFHPLVNFMPLDEYHKILLSANTFIYGNYRQAAVGNIVVALYAGATVFLNDKNPLLDYFLQMGCLLFPMSTLSEKIDYHLTAEEKNNNQQAILSRFSTEYMTQCIKESFA